MITIPEAFATSYRDARRRFLEAAAMRGLPIRSHLHPLTGPEGEDLALDEVRIGRPDAQSLLIVSSACHGVEGYCGSGVQVFALHDDEWLERVHAAGIAVLMLHALNPWGFAWDRRVTHEGVDLNRNFQDFSGPLPDNPAYGELHALLLPPHWPPDAANEAAIAAWIEGHGMAAFQSAVSQGQYEFADGLFYGGRAPTWSHLKLRAVLRAHGGAAARIGWIDLHTGLGPTGIGERIWAGRDDAQAMARAVRWWGGDGATPITSIYDGTSASSRLSGMMWSAIHDECPQAEYTGIALEFGTQPIGQVIAALRGDHWLARHRQAPAALAATIRAQMRAAFHVDTDGWKGQVISQARQALFQAVDGLAGG